MSDLAPEQPVFVTQRLSLALARLLLACYSASLHKSDRACPSTERALRACRSGRHSRWSLGKCRQPFLLLHDLCEYLPCRLFSKSVAWFERFDCRRFGPNLPRYRSLRRLRSVPSSVSVPLIRSGSVCCFRDVLYCRLFYDPFTVDALGVVTILVTSEAEVFAPAFRTDRFFHSSCNLEYLLVLESRILKQLVGWWLL